MLGFLKKAVREIRLEAVEIADQRRERGIRRSFKKQLDFSPVDLVAIDLLVLEVDGTNDGVSAEELLPTSSQARVRRERPVLGQPGTDRALRYLEVEAVSHGLLGFGDGVAEIERRDRLENRSQWIGPVLSRLSSKAMEAFGAAVHLQRPQAILPFALLDGVLAPALRAGGILAGSGCD